MDQPAGEAACADGVDLDRSHAPDQTGVALAAHRLEPGASSGDLAVKAAASFEKDWYRATDEAGVERPLMEAQSPLQNLQSPFLRRSRDLTVGRGRGRSGPARILEREGGGVANFIDQAQSGLEIGVAFAWEADDEVRG